MRPLLLIALTLTVAACGSDDPAAVDLTGTWTGSYTHPLGTRALTLDLNSTDEAVDGTFSGFLPTANGGSQAVSGDVAGSRPSGNAVEFTITDGAITWAFVGQLTNASLMQGTWESVSGTAVDGLFELRRQ